MSGRADELVHSADPEVARRARILVQQTERIARIVEQLLAFGRRRPPRITRCDLIEPVRQVIELVAPEARRRSIKLAVEADDHDHRIEADVDQLQQVALNLVKNAMHATPDRGTIVVRVEGADDMVRLSVRDNGAGIAADVQRHLFEPFFTTRATEGGTGLGLAVVRAITVEHGGTIEVRSELGHGAEFIARFPRTHPEGPCRAARLLIVDDDPAIVDLLREVLSTRYDVTGETSSLAALERLAVEDFDVVISDVEMPGMRGTELLARILERKPGQLVLMITAFGSIELAVAAIRAGACDFVTKPFKTGRARARDRARPPRAVDAARARSACAGGSGEPADDGGNLVANSPAMRRVLELARRAARSDATMLLTGESGVGKGALAQLDPRSQPAERRPARPGQLRGAAERPRRGRAVRRPARCVHRRPRVARRAVRRGHAGHAVPRRDRRDAARRPAEAAAGRSSRGAVARSVAPTRRGRRSRDRREQPQPGRGDQRGSVPARPVLPAQRDPARDPAAARPPRGHPDLAHGFRARVAKGQHTPIGITDEALRWLAKRDWPGNVRELANVIERAVALTDHETIVLEDVRDVGDLPAAPTDELLAQAADRHLSLDEVERGYIQRVLDTCDGNVSRAAPDPRHRPQDDVSQAEVALSSARLGPVRWDSPFVHGPAGTLAIHVILLVAGDAIDRTTTRTSPRRPRRASSSSQVEVPPIVKREPPPPVVRDEPKPRHAPNHATSQPRPGRPSRAPRRSARWRRAPSRRPSLRTSPPTPATDTAPGGDQVVKLDDVAPGGRRRAGRGRQANHAARRARRHRWRHRRRLGIGHAATRRPRRCRSRRSRSARCPRATTATSTPARTTRPRPSQLGIEGAIRVRLVVDDQGKVKSAVLLNKLGHGLDELALARAQADRVRARAGHRRQAGHLGRRVDVQHDVTEVDHVIRRLPRVDFRPPTATPA